MRLYEVKVDEKRWKIVEIDNKDYYSYKIIDKDNEEIYFLNSIIGVEQVTEDEFLVYRRASYDDFEIIRYKFQNSKLYQLFSQKFNQFHFISDDRILFTYYGKDGNYRFDSIYSIEENKKIKEAEWLNLEIIEVYKDDTNPNNVKLYIEEKLYSSFLNDPLLLFTVDPNTLQPNSDCYSQLRNSYIKVNSKEDIEEIRLAEQKYIRIIEKNMYDNENEQLKKVKEKILNQNKIK